MYALIYDEYDLSKPQKKVISVHRTRKTADKALEKRMRKLDKKVWECNTRIVWVKNTIKAGGFVSPGEHSVWRPGEEIPHGELYASLE